MVWVKDASRSVPTAAALLSDAQRPKLLADVKADYDSLRTRHAAKSDRKLLTYEQARADATPIDWDGYVAAAAQGSPACTCSTTTTSPSCATTSTGSRSSTPGR